MRSFSHKARDQDRINWSRGSCTDFRYCANEEKKRPSHDVKRGYRLCRSGVRTKWQRTSYLVRIFCRSRPHRSSGVRTIWHWMSCLVRIFHRQGHPARSGVRTKWQRTTYLVRLFFSPRPRIQSAFWAGTESLTGESTGWIDCQTLLYRKDRYYHYMILTAERGID